MKFQEQGRIEALHSAINKFVVYEKFSEMNNKYDINNFSKLLEDFNPKDEIDIMNVQLGDLAI